MAKNSGKTDLSAMFRDFLTFVERNLPRRHIWLFVVACFGAYLLTHGVDIVPVVIFMVLLTNLGHVNDAIADWKRRNRAKDILVEEQSRNDDAVRKGRKRIRADEPELPLENSVNRGEVASPKPERK